MAGKFSLEFKEAIAYSERKKVELPDEFYGLRQKYGATTVSGLAGMSQIQFVIEQLNTALRDGKTFGQFKKMVRDGELNITLPDHRLDTIFRTNIQQAYNFGRWQQQELVKDTRPYLMYDAVNDSRTRPTHMALDNTILPRDDPFWRTHYPPLGYRCRCIVVSLSQSQAEKRGIAKEAPNVMPDDGFGDDIAAYFDNIEQRAKQKLTDYEQKLQKSSKFLALLENTWYNNRVAVEKVNSMVSTTMITGPVKEQYVNMLNTLSANDPTIGPLSIRLLSDYIQNSSASIKSFFSQKSSVKSDIVAASWIKDAWAKVFRAAPNDSSTIYSGVSASNQQALLTTFSAGSVVKLVAPVSFSTDRTIADIHASLGGVIIHVNEASGVGIDILKAGATTMQAKREQEVLVLPDTVLEVLKVEKGIDGYTHVYTKPTTKQFDKEF